MTPLQVKAYLSSNSRASVAQLAEDFAIDLVLARDLLLFWVRRGYCKPILACGGCHVQCENQCIIHGFVRLQTSRSTKRISDNAL